MRCVSTRVGRSCRKLSKAADGRRRCRVAGFGVSGCSLVPAAAAAPVLHRRTLQDEKLSRNAVVVSGPDLDDRAGMTASYRSFGCFIGRVVWGAGFVAFIFASAPACAGSSLRHAPARSTQQTDADLGTSRLSPSYLRGNMERTRGYERRIRTSGGSSPALIQGAGRS